jgi:hypothetical protein
MDIGLWLKDWSTPLSAIATLAAVIVALTIGVVSLKQSQIYQKRERKERLLNEIIEWARNIIEYDNSEVLYSIDKAVEKDNPAMKSLLLSMNENTYYLQFKNMSIDVILPSANIYGHEPLISSIKSLDTYINTYLSLLGGEQIAMMKEISSGKKQFSKETDELIYRTIAYKRDTLPVAAQKVVKEAIKYRLMF